MPPESASTIRQILALDVGRRRIGVAISDPLGITAQPLLTLHRTTERADIRSLARLVRRYGIAAIVVGDPVHLSGETGPQALKVRRFADTLQAATGVAIHLLDERLTSAEAHTLLDQTGPRVTSRNTRQKRESVIDQVAAVLLLEAFLSMRSPRLLAPPSESSPGTD